MINIVKRLRDLGDRAAYEPHMHHAAADQIEALEAELARLREALALIRGGREIARGDGQHEWSPLDEWQAHRIADDALSPVETDPQSG